ncbi:MAG TPA: nitrogen fixation protein [Candidatus Kapabacteria bacterium]|nr:nitrogen fixation protein [Candidatus Kapabacteria bacterium]
MNSTRQLIAVAVDRSGNVASHAGRAHRWTVFDAWPNGQLEVAYSIQLAEHACLHEWHVSDFPERHPLHAVDVAIAASGGEGVQRRLGERNTRLLTTAELDPVVAVKQYLMGQLAPGLPHDANGCGGEGHQHAVPAHS